MEEKLQEIQSDIDIANEKMRELLKNDNGVTFVKKDGVIEKLDLSMDKTLFDMYWNIRQKSYSKLEQILKEGV